jgi:hypothetical protein
VKVGAYGAVEGLSRVYAAGDGTTFPVKQGGIAAQQADTAAAAIAASLGAGVKPEPFEPVLRGRLLDGESSRFLRRRAADRGEVSLGALWWPPGKIAARRLGPYLAASGRSPGGPGVLVDRPPRPRKTASRARSSISSSRSPTTTRGRASTRWRCAALTRSSASPGRSRRPRRPGDAPGQR